MVRARIGHSLVAALLLFLVVLVSVSGCASAPDDAERAEGAITGAAGAERDRQLATGGGRGSQLTMLTDALVEAYELQDSRLLTETKREAACYEPFAKAVLQAAPPDGVRVFDWDLYAGSTLRSKRRSLFDRIDWLLLNLKASLHIGYVEVPNGTSTDLYFVADAESGGRYELGGIQGRRGAPDSFCADERVRSRQFVVMKCTVPKERNGVSMRDTCSVVDRPLAP